MAIASKRQCLVTRMYNLTDSLRLYVALISRFTVTAAIDVTIEMAHEEKAVLLTLMSIFMGMLLVIYVAHHGFALPVSTEMPKEKKTFQFEDLIPLSYKFAQKGWNGTWITGTEMLYFRQDVGGLFIFDFDTKNSSLFIPDETLKLLNTTDVTLSPDGEFLLARSDVLTGFRYSKTARFALHDIKKNITYRIAHHNRLQYCVFGGQNHSVGFVYDNDVYYLEDITKNDSEQRLTMTGVVGVIYNGIPDWVYEEEVFGAENGLWFSGDGSRMAIASFNDTEVDVATYVNYGDPSTIQNQYATLQSLRYPKVGRKNPDVSLRVINLSDINSSWITLDPPNVGVDNTDTILGTVTWASENEVAALWLNRRQNRSILVICNSDNGKCTDEVRRSEPKGWIEITTPIFKDNRFLDITFMPQGPSGTNEWLHLVQYKRSVKEPIALSNGTRTAISILGWNQELDKVYYLSTLENEPWQKHLWVGGSESKCISCDLQLPGSARCRYVIVNMSPNAETYSLTCQGGGPASTTIYNGHDDSVIMKWEENEELRDLLEEYWMPKQVNMRIPVNGGFEAAVKMFLPPNMNANQSYPMVVNIYTGPNSARVVDSFSLGYQTFMSTNRSVIYCLIEGRGSGLKGKDMLFTINNRLGTDEVEDVIDVTRKLTNQFSWIDKKKIGLWGWSYGGFATAMALTKDDKNVFRCGISVAPVTSWLYYDTIYTERFMGTPQDNPYGYHEGDVNNRARLLSGKRFLLMHGNADDNVHYQNAMALAKSLQELDIQFEQMSYPDEAHGLSKVTKHVYHTIDNFWLRCFQD